MRTSRFFVMMFACLGVLAGLGRHKPSTRSTASAVEPMGRTQRSDGWYRAAMDCCTE